jgi:hypothetical protein
MKSPSQTEAGAKLDPFPDALFSPNAQRESTGERSAFSSEHCTRSDSRRWASNSL